MTTNLKKGLLMATVGLMLGCGNVAPIQTDGAAPPPDAAPLAAVEQETAPTVPEAESKDYAIAQYGGYWFYRCRRRCAIYYPRYSWRYQACIRRCYYRGGGYGRRY